MPDEEWIDPRAISVEVTAIDGVPVTEETRIVGIEPVRLDNGDVLAFQSPLVPAFYLLSAE